MRKFYAWIVDHPWLVIGVVVLLTLGALAVIPRLTVQTDFKDYLSKKDPAVQALNRAENRYGSPTFFMVSVVAPDTIFNTKTLDKIVAMREEFATIPGVDEVRGPINSQIITGTEKSLLVGSAAPGGKVPTTPQAMAQYKKRVLDSRMLVGYIVSADGKAATISIKLKKDATDTAVAKRVLAIVTKYDTGPEKIYIAGLPYMNLVLSESMSRDLRVMLPIVILVIIIVLFFSFRSLRGVLLPLLVVILSTIWAVGAMALSHVPMTVISFIMPIILLAIGIAYCIHVINKYYEELAAGKERREAVIETGLMMTSPVAMAGMTTVAGFLSLLNSFLIPQQQFGVFTALGVALAMGLSLVLIPAMLAVLPIPKRRSVKSERTGALGRVLMGFERVVIHHTRSVLVVSLLIMIVFGIGTAMVRVESSEKEFLGKEHPAVQALNIMNKYFSGSEQVVIEFDTGKRNGLKDPQLLKKIVAFENWLETKPSIKINKTISLADLVREMNQKFHADNPSYYRIPDNPNLVAQLLLLFTFQGGDLGNMALGDFSAGEVTGLYNSCTSSDQVRLTKDIQAYLKAHFPDVHAEMVGETRIAGTMFAKIIFSQITSLLTSIIASGLIVALLMHSLIAGLISLIPLVLTILIAFGVMGFSHTPLDMSTLMVSSIAIGIGIDYAIHFIERFRREYRRDQVAERALTDTIQTTGRGITFNALALALGFAVLLFSSFKGTRNFGLLISMTMVISALSAFTTIPAILVTWKPKFLLAPAWGKKRAVVGGKQTAAGESPIDGNKKNINKKEDNHEKN